MYQAFNLSIDSDNFKKVLGNMDDYYHIGKNLFDKDTEVIVNDLDKYISMGDSLFAKDMMDDWFKQINADIFLSHSHKDEKLVVALAGWLWEKFQLKSFIDSTVWGYSNNLLKSIDDKYCKNPDGYYNYEKRNYSTTHIHMMLSMSLLSMMDRCECLFFINTPNSFIPKSELDNGNTLSPWIYSEITASSMLRIKKPINRYVPVCDSLQEGLESYKEKSYQIEYPLNKEHLIDLGISDLNSWDYRQRECRGEHSLDLLYKLTQKVN